MLSISMCKLAFMNPTWSLTSEIMNLVWGAYTGLNNPPPLNHGGVGFNPYQLVSESGSILARQDWTGRTNRRGTDCLEGGFVYQFPCASWASWTQLGVPHWKSWTRCEGLYKEIEQSSPLNYGFEVELGSTRINVHVQCFRFL
jgi:hypothetical protein